MGILVLEEEAMPTSCCQSYCNALDSDCDRCLEHCKLHVSGIRMTIGGFNRLSYGWFGQNNNLNLIKQH